MAKYGPLAQKIVEEKLSEYKHRSRFKSRQQAIAVGLSEAREKGGKAPPAPKNRRSTK